MGEAKGERGKQEDDWVGESLKERSKRTVHGIMRTDEKDTPPEIHDRLQGYSQCITRALDSYEA